MEAKSVPSRHKRARIIIHFDYDCFYASVFEVRSPALRSLPLAVQQKQIIVTCNYEARRRGLFKLQLIRDAKRICPEVIIKLGEDISQFRDASKELYTFIKSFSWSNRIERLGFDEVWMDVTDIVDYNMGILLNGNDMRNSFFQISKEDPTAGFAFDATKVAGHTFPKSYRYDSQIASMDNLAFRLLLGSHLALYLRHELEQQKGYTCTVGIATSKLVAKLCGNLNKPKGQTTLMPPLYKSDGEERGNVTEFIDAHEVGKIPGIGFKLSQKLRGFMLQRPAEFDAGLVYGGTKEPVTVADLRHHPEINPQMLEKLLAGPGSPRGIGLKIWCLLHGVDDTEVSCAKAVPSQISIEDSYKRLDTMPEVLNELTTLATSLIKRMRIDLLVSEDDFDPGGESNDDVVVEAETLPTKSTSIIGKKWLAHPKTLRLSTRPRQPLLPDGTRVRSFKRISHSAPLPNFVFNLHEHVGALAERLVTEALITMFRKLHPEKAGWSLHLVNIAVTNMAETAGDTKSAKGRDIGNMFRRQEDVLRDFRVTDVSPPPALSEWQEHIEESSVSEDVLHVKEVEELGSTMFDAEEEEAEEEEQSGWDEGEDDDPNGVCFDCGLRLPAFAMAAHRRYHVQTGD